MALNSETSHHGGAIGDALVGARIVCLMESDSIVPKWLEEAGARVDLWVARQSLTEAVVHKNTRDALAIVIDLDLGISGGIRTANMVSPLCGVLFTAESIDFDTCRRIRRAHWGYRSKHASREDLLLAMQRLVRLDVPDIARIAARAVHMWNLSPQQARVLYYDLWAYCDQDIADALDVSIHTVQEYQEELRKKTGARGKQGYLARLLEVSGMKSPLSPARPPRSESDREPGARDASIPLAPVPTNTRELRG